MFAHSSRHAPHLPAAARQAGGRLRRLTAVLAAVACSLLASSAIIPAAFAETDPGGYGGITSVAPPATVRVVTAGGMAGWQITLIALGAALIAAAVTIVLSRARAAHRAAPSPAA
jgi:hypothetical protein